MPGDFHLVVFQCRVAVGIIIEQRWRFGNLHIVIQVQVFQIRGPGAMGGLMLAHQHEWLVRVTLGLEPVQGQVRRDIGGVAGIFRFAVSGYEIGIVIVALAGKDLPVVKARRLRFEVPLADQRSLITALLHQLRECLLRAIELVLVGHLSVGVAVLAGQNRGPTGGANGVTAKAAFQHNTFAPDAVDVRRSIDF